MNTLHVDSIWLEYESKKILTDIYLSCQQGEIVGLLGKNGSGKSSLLKIIFGIQKAQNKFVRVNDINIKSVANGRTLLNYLPQDNFIPKHLKVVTAISVFCDNVSSKSLIQNEFLKKMLSKKIGTLSGGEIRLLEVFLLIHSKAQFILLDEPFNGVAPLYKDEIKRLIKEQSRHKGFIITDHDYENILDVSHRIVLLKNRATIPIKNRQHLVEEAYLPG